MQMLSEMASDKLNHIIFQLNSFCDKLCQKMNNLKDMMQHSVKNYFKIESGKKKENDIRGAPIRKSLFF